MEAGGRSKFIIIASSKPFFPACYTVFAFLGSFVYAPDSAFFSSFSKLIAESIFPTYSSFVGSFCFFAF